MKFALSMRSCRLKRSERLRKALENLDMVKADRAKLENPSETCSGNKELYIAAAGGGAWC